MAGESGYVESLQAREHRVTLDDPALALPAEPGREHVLIYEATPEDRAYVIPVGLPIPAGSPERREPELGDVAAVLGGAGSRRPLPAAHHRRQ